MRRMRLLPAALLLLTLLAAAICTDARRVNGVGYDADFPPNRNVPMPHLRSPTDTKLIAERYPREAQLACVEEAPVFRVVTCDILTWDGCGNVYGRYGNETLWKVEVRHGVTGAPARLTSPIIHLEEGVFRFYFTPTEIGAFVVKAWRDPRLKLQTLTTPETMEQIVVVHDTVAKCTSASLANTHAQLRQLLWTQVSISNELQPVVGVDGISKETHVVVDTTDAYARADAMLQQTVRRRAVVPVALSTLGEIPREDNNNFNLCDVIQQS